MYRLARNGEEDQSIWRANLEQMGKGKTNCVRQDRA